MNKLKQILITVAISVFISFSFYAVVVLEQRINGNNGTIIYEDEGAVYTAIKTIIKREGNTSESVARMYTNTILEASIKHSVDPILILSVIAVESKFDFKASSNGALGLMQIVASFHRDKVTMASSLFDPKRNIEVGVRILKDCLQKSRSEAEALLRYNGSLGSAGTYAYRVIEKKRKYEAEILTKVNLS
jgi:soluble lytic murein transglycosylase-like protein